MNKQAFLEGLAGYLDALDPEEIKKTCAYYAEMIDDRVEEGMDEEQAVASLEPLPVIAKEILSQAPLGNLIRARARTGRRLSGGAIALIAIGSPIWLPVDVYKRQGFDQPYQRARTGDAKQQDGDHRDAEGVDGYR